MKISYIKNMTIIFYLLSLFSYCLYFINRESAFTFCGGLFLIAGSIGMIRMKKMDKEMMNQEKKDKNIKK